MRWRDAVAPVGMQRIALLAREEGLRDLLVAVAVSGNVELDAPPPREAAPQPGSAAARLARLRSGTASPLISPSAPDLARCEREGRVDLIAGEAEIDAHADGAVHRRGVAALLGWTPSSDLTPLQQQLADVGAAAVPMPRLPTHEPPTLLSDHTVARAFAPLVRTYATVPYADLDPSVAAGIAYVVMFGMMFADLGHGALLLAAALVARLAGSTDGATGWRAQVARLRPVWLFLAGAGASSMLFGALYGEFFGPTGVVPVGWIDPMQHPVTLLGAAVGVGGVLLSGAYALGTVNRVREGGWRRALYAPAGLAGASLFAGLGVVAGGVFWHLEWLVLCGAGLCGAGLLAAYAGLVVAAGGSGSGALQAAVELFDLVIRTGSNLVSFARLAAFGLTHAALGAVVWDATAASARHGLWGWVGAIAVFVAGNTLTFFLEGLVAAIQALRLEYYELFSRIFDPEGRPFQPWHLPLASPEATP